MKQSKISTKQRIRNQVGISQGWIKGMIHKLPGTPPLDPPTFNQKLKSDLSALATSFMKAAKKAKHAVENRIKHP